MTHAFPARSSSDLLGIAEEILFPDGVPVVEDDHRGALLRALQGGGLVARGMAAAPGAAPAAVAIAAADRSEEPTSELQSLMRISYAVFCLKKKNQTINILKLDIKPSKTRNN